MEYSQWGNCDVTIRTEASRNRIIEILFVWKRMLLVGYSMHLFYYMVFFRSSGLRKWKLTQLEIWQLQQWKLVMELCKPKRGLAAVVQFWSFR